MSLNTQVARTRGPIRCLVVQLARMGDTLQSLMALRAAKQLYPDLEIHFIARERFAGAAKRVPWIENVITLPTDSILGPVLSGERTEKQSLGDLARWIGPLVKEPWDLVVNWSYSEASSYLTGLMPGRVKLGFSRRKDTTFSSADGWSNYIQGVVQGGTGQNIHLTDILTTQLLTALQIHFGEPANEGNSPVTSKTFFALELGEKDLNCSMGDLSRKWIAIQLGAGRADKTWNAKSWARLASLILDRHPEHNVVLLGGKEDLQRARQFKAELRSGDFDERRVVSLVGETDFDLWASVVGRCQWLFAGDTAAIHLASVLGTRVFNLSVGPARWSETGPYGNGHYVLSTGISCVACEKQMEGLLHTCADSVSPEAAYATWSYAVSEWNHRRQNGLAAHFSQLGYSEHLDRVKVHRSKIRGSAEGGGVQYESMLPRPFELGDWTGMVMGHIARAWYCGWVPPIGQELSRAMLNPALLKKLRELEESADVLSKVCDEARRTALLLKQRSGHLRSDKIMRLRDRDELRDLGKKLMELDGLTERLGRTHPPLQAFGQMSKVLMHNLSGAHLSELGGETAEAYKQLGDGVTILRDWIRHTLGLARPVALRADGLVPLGIVQQPSQLPTET